MSYRRPPRSLPDRLAAEASEARRSRAYRTAGPISFGPEAHVARGVIAQNSLLSLANPAPAWGYYGVLSVPVIFERDRWYNFRGFLRGGRSAAGRSNIAVVLGYDPSDGSFDLNLGDFPTHWQTTTDTTANFNITGTMNSQADGEERLVWILVENAVTVTTSTVTTAQLVVSDEGAA